MSSETYVRELLDEQENLSKDSHAYHLIELEIARVQGKGGSNAWDGGEREDVIVLKEKVFVPVKLYPKFNFIGKLLGPQGNTFKRLQQQTRSRMMILGKGSMKDKEKEDELRKSDDEKNAHLKEDLHVLISVKAPKAEAHARLAGALKEIKRYMQPQSDDISKEQQREMAAIKGGYEMADEEEEEIPSPTYGGRQDMNPGREFSTRQRSPIGGGHQVIYPGGDFPKNLPPGAIIIQMPSDGQAQAPNPRFKPYGSKKFSRSDDPYAKLSR